MIFVFLAGSVAFVIAFTLGSFLTMYVYNKIVKARARKRISKFTAEIVDIHLDMASRKDYYNNECSYRRVRK